MLRATCVQLSKVACIFFTFDADGTSYPQCINPYSHVHVVLNTVTSLNDDIIITPISTSRLFYNRPGLYSHSILTHTNKSILPVINNTPFNYYFKSGEVIALAHSHTHTTVHDTHTHTHTTHTELNSITLEKDRAVDHSDINLSDRLSDTQKSDICEMLVKTYSVIQFRY